MSLGVLRFDRVMIFLRGWYFSFVIAVAGLQLELEFEGVIREEDWRRRTERGE